jgi:hypothetical protein
MECSTWLGVWLRTEKVQFPEVFSISVVPARSQPLQRLLEAIWSAPMGGRATATLTVQVGGGPANLPLNLVISSNASARVIDFDDTGSGWGNLDLQDASTFSAGISGTYVFTLDGFDSSKHPLAIAGRFNAGGGAVSLGIEDINDNGVVTQNASFTGALTGADSSTGRASVTLNVGGETIHFFLYMLAQNAFVLISGDKDVGYIGSAVQANAGPFSNSSLSGNMVFVSLGYNLSPAGPASMAGVLTANGSGVFTQGAADSDIGGTIGSNLSSSGTYSLPSDGHGTVTLSLGGTPTYWRHTRSRTIISIMSPSLPILFWRDSFSPKPAARTAIRVSGGIWAFRSVRRWSRQKEI